MAQVGRHEYWPVFNAADAGIVAGAVILAVRYSRTSRLPERTRAEEQRR